MFQTAVPPTSRDSSKNLGFVVEGDVIVTACYGFYPGKSPLYKTWFGNIGF